MKRSLTILVIIALSALIVYACGSTIPTGNTSFVTISIGGGSRTARLHAEQATAWTRFKYLLADAKILPEAQAYVPSVVQIIVVTVSAADLTTPIVGIDTLTPDQTSSTIRIEVPNGAARVFTVEGIRGIDSTTYYRGTATADLDGTDVNLPVSMSFVGPGIWVDPSRLLSANTTTCGATQATACATITHVLNSRPATTANDVVLALAGSYLPGSVAAIETFPLQLKPGMALICMGTNFSSVIDVSTVSATAVLGNSNASIDNCKIKVGLGSTGVNDQAALTKINGVHIEIASVGTSPSTFGAVLSGNSSVLESTITGSGSVSGPVYGVQVNGGTPGIISSTVSNLPNGIFLTASAGDAVISGTMVTGNSTGISVQAVGKPRITQSTISNSGSYGIYVTAGSADISGNIITNNAIGLDIETGASNAMTISANSLYCNSIADLFTNLTSTLVIQNNAWDHDGTTSPAGPTEMLSMNGPFGCSGGADICYQGAKPLYQPYSSAVPNGCRILAKPSL